ncbi:peptide deformylase [Frankia sp. AgPm24]|uniref:peptide deformylase n=1 Tax=Frankia sp. AgPm24 TaxID=631128 RepID=UPI00200C4A67|nr:peptide deformylase [Frankia sp. AgPm24]MCK9925554.1 peptide deformylase [Frankia sp. AgPm24]
MAVLPIRTVGDPVLRTPAVPVTTFDAALARLVEDMIETMYAAPGVGLAAPQVGVGLRIFVYDVGYSPGDPAVPRHPRVVVNPVLTLDEERPAGEETSASGGASAGEGTGASEEASAGEGTGASGAVDVGEADDIGGAEDVEDAERARERGVAEGCLSVPGLYFPTPRAWRATVRGVDVSGEPVEYTGQGLAARCFQHECDHLDGILYLSRLTGAARVAAVRALREALPAPGDGQSAGSASAQAGQGASAFGRS